MIFKTLFKTNEQRCRFQRGCQFQMFEVELPFQHQRQIQQGQQQQQIQQGQHQIQQQQRQQLRLLIREKQIGVKMSKIKRI